MSFFFYLIYFLEDSLFNVSFNYSELSNNLNQCDAEVILGTK